MNVNVMTKSKLLSIFEHNRIRKRREKGYFSRTGNLHTMLIYVLSRVLVNVVTSVRNNGECDALFHFSG